MDPLVYSQQYGNGNSNSNDINNNTTNPVVYNQPYDNSNRNSLGPTPVVFSQQHSNSNNTNIFTDNHTVNPVVYSQQHNTNIFTNNHTANPVVYSQQHSNSNNTNDFANNIAATNLVVYSQQYGNNNMNDTTSTTNHPVVYSQQHSNNNNTNDFTNNIATNHVVSSQQYGNSNVNDLIDTSQQYGNSNANGLLNDTSTTSPVASSQQHSNSNNTNGFTNNTTANHVVCNQQYGNSNTNDLNDASATNPVVYSQQHSNSNNTNGFTNNTLNAASTTSPVASSQQNGNRSNNLNDRSSTEPVVSGQQYCNNGNSNSNSNDLNDKSNNNNGSNDEFVETIEKILAAEGERSDVGSPMVKQEDGGNPSSRPLSLHELSELSMLCTKATSLLASSTSAETAHVAASGEETSTSTTKHGYAAVDLDLLEALLGLLEKHVNLAAGVDLVQEANQVINRDGEVNWWLRNNGDERINTLKEGLTAATILLFIMTSPGVERRVVSVDAIEASITLLRQNLVKNIVPALNNTGHRVISSTTSDEAGSSRRKRRRGTAAPSEKKLERELKKVYKHIESCVGLHLLLMERIEKLIQMIPLDDQQILVLTSGSMPALEIDASHSSLASPGGSGTSSPAHLLQMATISVVTCVFKKYPVHRDVIIEDLFPLMLKLPSGKRSLRTFPVRFTSCPCPGGMQLLTSSLYASMLPNGQNPHFIQVISALVLSLIQICVVRPTFTEVAPSSSQDVDENGEPVTDNDNGQLKETVLSSGLQECQTVCDSFARQMLQRCARKGEDGGASEFRPVLHNLIDDLLLVLLIPEYAAAEMLLLSLSNLLSRDIINASATHKQSSRSIQSANLVTPTNTTETTYMTTAFDSLGKICAVQAKIQAVYKEKPLKFPSTINPPSSEGNGTKNIDCYCGRNLVTQTLMVDCDRCHTWFHAHCVGLTRDTVPNDWYCDSCLLSKIIRKEQNADSASKIDMDAQHNDNSSSVIDKNFAMRRILESYLHEISKTKDDVGYTTSVQLLLAKWIEDLYQESNQGSTSLSSAKNRTEIERVIAKLLNRWDGTGDATTSNQPDLVGSSATPENPSYFTLTEEGNIRSALALRATSSSFVLSFRNQLGLMLKLMSDNASPHLRKSSVRAIEKVVDADPKVMLFQIVMKAVSARFSDDAISVREAVVALVGNYVVRSPAVANAFHSSFLPRLRDPGVSVRKRTVQILQDILCSNPEYKGRYAACNLLLQRAADPKEDDGVRDLIHELFLKLWLEDGNMNAAIGTPGHSAEPNAGGVVTPTPPQAEIVTSGTRQNGSNTKTKRSDLAAEQMVEVVRVANTGEHLGAFLRELLCEASDVDKGKKVAERRRRQRVAQKQCVRLVKALFELLLSTEEKQAALGPQVAGKLIVANMRTICVFTEVSPTSAAHHLDTVLPYLKAANGLSKGDEAAIVTAAADILYRLCDVLGQSDMDTLSESSIADDLVHITYNFGSGAISSAVRAFSALAHHQYTGDDSVLGQRLLKLSKTFYSYLFKKETADMSTLDARTMNNIQRGLSVLGVVCRHHEAPIDAALWEEEVGNDDLPLIKPAQFSWSNLSVGCYRLFSWYLQKNHDPTKCSALRALAGIFGAHPRLMLAMEQSGLIGDVMSDKSHIDLQRESLRCWCDILLTEEKRVESGDAKAKMDSNDDITTSKRISGDQDSDATLVGGVLTKHSSRLFELTQSKHKELRLAALELLGHLLRQGMVNPNEAVPYLFALQGDVEDASIRSLALKYLTLEGEKRPDMLRQRICDGVKQACKFQQLLYPKKAQTSALVEVNQGNHVEVECVFDSVFREKIINIQKQRHGLYRNLLGLFEKTESTERKAHRSSTRASPRKSKNIFATTAASFDLQLLSFASQILAHLPYNTATDPLFIIYHITSIVAMQGAQLLDRLAEFLRPYGLSSSDEYDETNEDEDILEIAARTEHPMQSKDVEPMSKPDFDWPEFCKLCRQASAMALLLRLKEYLKKVYNLSDIRCIEYTPEQKDRIMHKGQLKVPNSKPFDASLLMIPGLVEKRVDQNAVIRQYAEYRVLMRAENTSEARTSGSDSENKKSRKRSASTGGSGSEEEV